MNQRLQNYLNIGLSIMISIDIILLAILLIFEVSTSIYLTVVIFDTILCIILLYEFFNRYKKAEDKRKFLARNWMELIAAMPFDIIMMPFVLYFTYSITLLKILRFVKIIALFTELMETIDLFLKKTHLDEILGITLLVIIASTLGLYLFDPSIDNLFESLWFVLSTITTVGFGDVVPTTAIGRALGLIILVIGVLIFSAVTGAMASYFTRMIFSNEDINITEHDENIKLLKEDLSFNKENLNRANEKIDNIDQDIDDLKQELDEIKEELKESKELNRQLKEEMHNLNESLKNK